MYKRTRSLECCYSCFRRSLSSVYSQKRLGNFLMISNTQGTRSETPGVEFTHTRKDCKNRAQCTVLIWLFPVLILHRCCICFLVMCCILLGFRVKGNVLAENDQYLFCFSIILSVQGHTAGDSFKHLLLLYSFIYSPRCHAKQCNIQSCMKH